MKNIFNIFKTDLNNIRKRKAAIIVIVALMILPSMYAWFNILPSWDPYSNTKDVAVAVVNLDEGGDVQGESFNVGDEIILSLLENEGLGWQFVDEEEAMRGVEQGNYYASIIIPQDFSSKLSSVLDETPEQPILDYYINEKINAIAPKVTNAGASGIVDSIQSGFVKVANEAIFTAFNDLGIELETNRAEIERFRDVVYQLEEELPEIERLLGVANTDIVHIEKAVGQANDGIIKAEEVSKEAEKMSLRLEETLREGDKSIQKYVPLVKQDLRIAQKVIQQIPDVTSYVTRKGEAIDDVLAQIVDGTEKIDDGAAALQTLATVLEDMNKRLMEEQKLESLNESLLNEIEKLDQLEEHLIVAISQLEKGDHIGTDITTSIDELAKDVEERLDNLIEAYEETMIPSIEDNLDRLREEGKKIAETIETAEGKNQELLDQVEEWIEEGPVAVDQQLSYVENMQDHVQEQISAIDQTIIALKLANKVPSNPDEESTKPTDESIELAIDSLTKVKEELELVDESLEEAKMKLEDGEDLTTGFWLRLKEPLETVDTHFTKLLSFTTEMEKQFDEAVKNLEQKHEQISADLVVLQKTAEEIATLTEQLVGKVENPEKLIASLRSTQAKVKEGKVAIQTLIDFNRSIQDAFNEGVVLEGVKRVEALETELQDFKTKILHAVDDAGKSKATIGGTLADIDDMAKGMDQSITALIQYIDRDLLPKYEEASDKANNALKEGNKLLTKANTYFPKLNELIDKIDDGVDQGQVGLDKANEFLPEAKEKVTDLAGKIRLLEERGDLEKIIHLMRNDPDAESEFFADPIFLNQHELFPIPNYGSAMSPFFTAMSLWVGGLILVSSLVVDVPNKHRYKSYEAYFGRFLTFWIIGLAQAFVVTMGNMFLLKTFVAHKVMFVLFGFFISTVFIVIVYTFVSVFGNTGKVIAIILLVMQLGASGGTFPIQMTPMFFQKIHNFLPFTHALGLFREAVGGIIWPVVLKHIAWLVGYIALFLFIGIKLKERINKSSDKFLEEARESEIIL